MADISYILAELRAKSPKDYIVTILTPVPLQRALITFYGFDLVLKQAVKSASEDTILGIRLQYWRDQIRAIYAGLAFDSGPELALIANLIAEHSITEDLWQNYIDAITSQHNIHEIPHDMDAFQTHQIAEKRAYWRLLSACIGGDVMMNEHQAAYYVTAMYLDRLHSDLAANCSKLPQDLRDTYKLSSNLLALGKSDMTGLLTAYEQRLQSLWSVVQPELKALPKCQKLLILQARYRHRMLGTKTMANINPKKSIMHELCWMIWLRFKY